ncbi:MAG: class I SAM-dependent methyltransferase [Chloroflexi bacterium]|nr:class I SAM-dependent methyltransferase [Chloroflexota bacterium]
MHPSPASLESTLKRVLACPRCHGSVHVLQNELRCLTEGCGFEGAIVDDVVVVGDRSKVSFFDDRHEVMEQSNTGEGVRSVFYEPQATFLKQVLPDRDIVVLDAGCGPALSYARKPNWFVIGLDPSYESVRANREVDLRIYGGAEHLPLPDHSVDAIVCFYSIHHMVGSSIAQNHANVDGVLREFERVVRKGGDVFIFEVSPWWPFWVIEQIGWPLGRKVLGAKLDMFFYTRAALLRRARSAFGQGRLETTTFRSDPWEWFPPVFSLQWLRMPRALYPFDVRLYRWSF